MLRYPNGKRKQKTFPAEAAIMVSNATSTIVNFIEQSSQLINHVKTIFFCIEPSASLVSHFSYLRNISLFPIEQGNWV